MECFSDPLAFSYHVVAYPSPYVAFIWVHSCLPECHFVDFHVFTDAILLKQLFTLCNMLLISWL
jgi:hypothetical protein